MLSPSKIDPTRSITLRRAFSQGLTTTFARLKKEIYSLLIAEDAFDLKTPTLNYSYSSTQFDVSDRKIVNAIKRIQSSIPPDDVIELEDEPHITIRYGLYEQATLPISVRTMIQEFGKVTVTIGGLSVFKTPEADVLKYDIESNQLRELNARIRLLPGHDSYEYSPHMTIAYLKRGTGERYITSSPEGKGTVLVFDTVSLSDTHGNKIPLSLNQRWRYKSQSEAVEEFDKWLKGRIAKTLLSPEESRKWMRYIQRGFTKGAARAYDDTSKARRTLDETRGKDFVEGKREGFLRVALGKVTAIEKMKLLQSRALSEVKGMTEDLRTKAKRIITDGVVQGTTPTIIAQRLSRQLQISKGRAETIAFTELVRAHADGQLEAMEQLGVEEVGVAVEWNTADDPCPLCEVLNGVVLKLSEARNMLPRHPRCRCAWLPANVGEEKTGQKRGKYKVDRAIKSSQKKEDNKSDWGPNTRISRERPRSVLNTSTEVCECDVRFCALMTKVFGDGH